MRKLLKPFAVAVLCVSGLVGCGGTEEPQLEDALASTEQELYMCADNGTMAGACPTGYTCVGNNDTCRKKCSPSHTCSTGEKCCLGYMYPDGSLMEPYCLPTQQTCYMPWAD